MVHKENTVSVALSKVQGDDQRNLAKHSCLAQSSNHAPKLDVSMTHLRVQGKASSSTVVHKQTARALALTSVKGEDQREFAKLVDTALTAHLTQSPDHA